MNVTFIAGAQPRVRLTAQDESEKESLRTVHLKMKEAKADCAFYTQGLGDWHLTVWLAL